jgi:hypothetical protein
VAEIDGGREIGSGATLGVEILVGREKTLTL